jgi:hypothetical protein
MTDVEYHKIRRAEIESLCLRKFQTDLTVKTLLFEDVPIAKGALATVFSTPDHYIYVLCESEVPLRFRDIQRAIKSMGFFPGAYAAPHGDKNYFKREGYEIFRNSYPGRTKWTSNEESYYQTLAPYSTALVRVCGVGSQVRRYNEFCNQWQKIYEPSRALSRSAR